MIVLTCAHAIGVYRVVLMASWKITGVTRTISVSIYVDVHALDFGRAHVTAAALLAVSFVTLVVTYSLLRRSPMAWRRD